MRHFTVIAAAVLALTLSGCETMTKMGESIKSIELPKISSKAGADKAAAGSSDLLVAGDENCPKVKALTDLASITQFEDITVQVPDKMVSTTKIEKIDAKCNASGSSVVVELGLDFAGTLGPIGVKDLDGQANYTYPYFLSVISPDGKILSKDVFALSMVYENGQISYHRQDKLRQVIPLLNGQAANQFQIIIGFQLTEDELAYNRRVKQ